MPEEVTEIVVDDQEPTEHPSLDASRSPDGDPTHPAWQGHTHSWPKHVRKDGAKVCRECELQVPADLLTSEAH